jgi:hypothetical protein
MITLTKLKKCDRHIRLKKQKNHMTISTNVERAFDKIHHCFTINIYSTLGIEAKQ